MDITKFGATSPGELIRVTTPWGPDHAFVPVDLPPRWEFPISHWPLLAQARQQIGVLEGLGRNLPSPAILLRPLADREAIQSSRLEGTFASPRQLLLYELDPRESRSPADDIHDHQEVYNYRRALEYGTASPLPISQRLMRELHEKLLAGVHGRDKDPGKFRRIQVGIGTGGRFIPPPPERLPTCLAPLEKYCHADPCPFDPLVDSFLIHYQFEAIHPFVDGNGRVGRLLLAIMLQQRLGLSKPWLYLSEFFEARRDEYIQRLFDVSTRGDWAGWTEFCLQGALQQATETISRCERLLKVREDFMARLATAGGSLRLTQIVDGIFTSPFVRLADLPQRLSCTYPTAKADITRLIAAGILSEVPNVRPKTYFAPAVYEVAYERLMEQDS